MSSSPQTKSGSGFLKSFLIGLALILFGVLVGVLAYRFMPIPIPVENLPIEPTPEISEEASPEATPIPTPTATPSALLSLKWTMMTVKSPVSFFSDYQIYYPSTWTIKTYKNVPGSKDSGSSTLSLVKGPATMTITQGSGDAPICLYPGDAEIEGMVSHFGVPRSIIKDSLEWKWGLGSDQSAISTYKVCEMKTNNFVASTAIGSITLTGDNLSGDTLEEFNYMLERLVILQ